jgi:PAS domain S-box-containing protein
MKSHTLVSPATSSTDALCLLIENLEDFAIFMLDAEGYIVSWNKGAERIYGYPVAEILGKHFSIFYLPEETCQEAPNLRLLTTKDLGRQEQEGWRLKKGGIRFWAKIVLTPLWASDGTLQGFAKLTRDITEHLETERTLKATNTMLRTIIETAPVGIAILDTAGKVKLWNHTAEKMFGWKQAEILGQELPTIPEDRQEEFAVLCEYVLQNHDIADLEVRRQRKDGSMFDVSLSTAPLQDDNGVINGTVRIMVNIAERKRAERRLALQYAAIKILNESDDLQSVVAKLLQAICKCLEWEVGIFWLVEPALPVLRCFDLWSVAQPEVEAFATVNRQLAFQLGSGLPGRTWAAKMPVWITNIAAEDCSARAAVAGQTHLYTAFGFPIVFNGEVLGVMEFFSYQTRQPERDIFDMLSAISSQIGQFIEHRRAEENELILQNSVKRAVKEWQWTFDAIESGILLLDARGNIMRGNRTAWDFIGQHRRRSRMIGSHISTLGFGPLWEGLSQLVKRVAARDCNCLNAQQIYDQRASKYWEIAAKTFCGEGEEDYWILLIIHDVTEKVSLQQSVRRSEMMSVLGSLVAGVAHEVRNPLFSMTATLDAFESDFQTHHQYSEYQEYIEVLRRELTRMSNLMRELLEYGKPPNSEFLPDSLIDLVNEAVASYRPIAAVKNIGLLTKVTSELPPMLMDRSRLLQVFNNLLDNALQYAPPNSDILIEIQKMRQNGNPTVECRIKDSGPGFSAEDLSRIFQPFFTRRRGGTGLGLSIVQRIVEQHGGVITASNRAEGGAVMTLSLPIKGAAYDEK